MLDFLTFISEQWLLVSLFLALFYIFMWRESRKGGHNLSVHQVTRLVNAGEAIMLDIREAKDFASVHIPGSINLPHTKLKDRIGELEKYRGQQLVVIDKFGQHSGTVGRELSNAGFKPARLRGGITEWQNSNLPVAPSK